ncbi:hypothetical protein HPB47_024851 [Ixodes persulcatus]|uniref:Uncharacterized protein n=1 Tax=Ixodes persulcatus TaxID=34615 RepID=A0AC60Q3F4_IXOPE|nr:hypothetical protein HPB47_024851 [Ixodes persulcatus]
MEPIGQPQKCFVMAPVLSTRLVSPAEQIVRRIRTLCAISSCTMLRMRRRQRHGASGGFERWLLRRRVRPPFMVGRLPLWTGSTPAAFICAAELVLTDKGRRPP